jgi:CubicO group peptidase (beta-lactamase class C family)
MTAKSLQISFILISTVLLFSCSKKEKSSQNESVAEQDTFVHFSPPDANLPKLAPAYKKQKHDLIDRYSSKLWNKNDNVSFLVARNGEIIYEKYNGFADNKKNFITKETPLHIASVSKVLTAAAIMKLVEAGRIELDQKVNTILKTFPYPEVTVRTLLNHRSGLRNYAYFTSEKEIWNTRDTLTNQDILRLLGEKHIPLATPTDTHFAYCNTNYAMLALVIEKVTGVKYAEAMNRIIFKPLGMTNTFVFDLSNDKERVSQTYKGNMRLAFDFLDAVYGDKNIYSTPRDLLKFDMATYSKGYLKKKLFKQIYKGYSYESKGTKNYGLGIRMIEFETGQHFYFHNGWWHGNTSAYVTLRDEKVTIIALSNKMSKKTYLVRKLAPAFGDYPFKKNKDEEGPE